MFCSSGLELNCSFDQSDPCYTALGHKLNLQMVQDARDQELYLYKDDNGTGLNAFIVKNNKEKKHESIRNRSEFFFDNMTLTINNVTKPDSGRYTSFVIEIDMAMESDLQVIVEGIEALSNIFYFRNALRLTLITC